MLNLVKCSLSHKKLKCKTPGCVSHWGFLQNEACFFPPKRLCFSQTESKIRLNILESMEKLNQWQASLLASYLSSRIFRFETTDKVYSCLKRQSFLNISRINDYDHTPAAANWTPPRKDRVRTGDSQRQPGGYRKSIKISLEASHWAEILLLLITTQHKRLIGPFGLLLVVYGAFQKCLQ